MLAFLPPRVAMSDYVPTIDDLRVKLCYICRDEELYNGAQLAVLVFPN